MLKSYKQKVIISSILVLFFLSMFYILNDLISGGNVKIRNPAVTGRYYSSDSIALSNTIDSLLNQAESKNIENVKALVVPHAGYTFSGLTAAYGFKQLAGKDYDTVVIIGNSHHVFIKGFTIEDVTYYKTPLGLLELSPKVKELRKEPFYKTVKTSEEHSIEVELPFLQKVLKDFKIIPIVVGDMDPKSLAEMIKKYIDDKTLIIISTDLSHGYSYEKANFLDKKCLNYVSSLDIENVILKCEACGKTALTSLMFIAEDFDWKAELLDYRNSGDVSDDKLNVIGYASIAFY